MELRKLSAPTLLALAACGPIPGGTLGGRVAEVPNDWSAAIEQGRSICEVESRPSEPHSIQLDCFVYEGSLYVQSHRWALAGWWPVQSWAAIWIEHPDVRVRIDDSIFDLLAVQVTEERDRSTVLAFRGYEPVPEGVVLFRFEPRDQAGPGS